MRRALALALLLAACGREAPPPTPAAEVASFRAAGAPIASTTRGTPADLAGDWVVSAAYPGAPLAAGGTAVTVTPGPGPSAVWAFPDQTVATVLTAPGRYEGRARLWVLWVDDDFRTAAVGTPDGRFGWIMDRPGSASPDRTEAARRMLQFNGYDLARLAG